jgi:hypothetical protein
MTLRAIVLAVIVSSSGAATAAAEQVPPAPPPEPRPIELLDQQPAPAPPPMQPGTRPPGKPVSPPPTPAVQPPAETPPPGPVRKLRGRDANLQIEITITDQPGTEAPQKKVVSMLVADQTMGRIRASANAQREKFGFVGTGLNVDARPVMLEGDRILLELTVEYTPYRESGQVTQSPTVLNESLSVILQSGKPLVVSQAADPVTDRRMTLEVRATIAK